MYTVLKKEIGDQFCQTPQAVHDKNSYMTDCTKLGHITESVQPLFSCMHSSVRGGVQSFGKIRYFPPPPFSIFSPDFPETFDTNDETGFERLGEGEEGCETPSPQMFEMLRHDNCLVLK